METPVKRPLEQQIRFCTAPDKVRIAYPTVGKGPPLVRAAHWLTHLQYDLDNPVWGHWSREFSAHHQYIRYDERGCGLSDWDVKDFSFDAWGPRPRDSRRLNRAGRV